MDKIYASEPINNQASMVTSQKGCSSGILTDEQLRENLVVKVKRLSEKISLATDKGYRKLLGKEIAETNQRINKLRPKKKAPGVEMFYIDAAREVLAKSMFNLVMDRAVKNMKNASKTDRLIENQLELF